MSTVGAVTASAATFPRTPRSVITVTETDISLPSAETARETESYTNTENVPSATATARSETTIDDHIKNALQNEERFLFYALMRVSAVKIRSFFYLGDVIIPRYTAALEASRSITWTDVSGFFETLLYLT